MWQTTDALASSQIDEYASLGESPLTFHVILMFSLCSDPVLHGIIPIQVYQHSRSKSGPHTLLIIFKIIGWTRDLWCAEVPHLTVSVKHHCAGRVPKTSLSSPHLGLCLCWKLDMARCGSHLICTRSAYLTMVKLGVPGKVVVSSNLTISIWGRRTYTSVDPQTPSNQMEKLS